MAVEIRQLRVEDDRAAFASGDEALDLFFRRYAGQNQFRHHVGTTYVAVDAGEILGFATVSGASVEFRNVPPSVSRGLPQYPLPVLRLARLAVAASARGRGTGEALLRHVFDLAVDQSERVGCVGVVVDAKEQAVGYYRRFGFFEFDAYEGRLEDRPRPVCMFLPLSGIARH